MIDELVTLSGHDGKRFRCRSQLSGDMGSILVDLPVQKAPQFIEHVKPLLPKTFACLDFGCGNAPHRKALEAAGARWLGCDYAASTDPATLARQGSDLDGAIILYDGRVIPRDNSEFDVVWSWQSLEHVQEPELTFSEISRVLKVGGYFIGETSFLEPYHAQSTYSYTPYGCRLLCERHGLKLLECAPSLDGLYYILKRIAIVLDVGWVPQKGSRMTASQGPLRAIHDCLVASGREKEWVHLLAQICGTFRFTAIRQD